MSRVISIRISDDLAGRLDQLTASLNRSKSWLVEQALVHYIEEEAWQVHAIADALASYWRREASLLPHDEVMERLAAKIRAHG